MGLSPRLKFVIGGTLTILFWDNLVTAFFRRGRKLCHSLGRPSRSDFVQFEVDGENTMSFKLLKLEDCDLEQYKKDMQEAFQKGFEEDFGKTEEIILQEEDINRSLTTKGSVAYKAVVDDEMVGGAVVVIDEKTQHNHLDFHYVKYGTQSKGIGKKMWDEIERLHPQTKVWISYCGVLE